LTLNGDSKKEHSMASVDVFVPCYNYGRFLEDAVRSVLSQEGVNVRVLILDDCSADDSEVVGRALAAADSRVEYRRHAVNQGHIATYNEGLDWVAGDYCLLLSADDLLVPGALARAAAVMDAHPDVGLVHGRAVQTDRPDRVALPKPGSPAWQITSGRQYIQATCQSGENAVATPTAVLRTTVQKRIGGYRHELPHAGDMEMWLRAAVVSNVAYTDAYQAFYRKHGQNMSEGYFDEFLERDLQQRGDAFRLLFQNHTAHFPDVTQLQQMAFRSLSKEGISQATKAFESEQFDFCTRLMRLSVQLDPSIQSTVPWKKLRLKQLIGPRLWRTVGAVVRWMRQAFAQSTHVSTPK